MRDAFCLLYEANTRISRPPAPGSEMRDAFCLLYEANTRISRSRERPTGPLGSRDAFSQLYEAKKRISRPPAPGSEMRDALRLLYEANTRISRSRERPTEPPGREMRFLRSMRRKGASHGWFDPKGRKLRLFWQVFRPTVRTRLP